MMNNGYPAKLEIDLGAIAKNYRIIDALGNAQTACVIKADAYGLGMVQVAPILEKAGCRLFCVATLEEGITLRQILPQAEIVILGGFYKGAEREYTHHNLIPVLNSPEEVERAQGQARVILHFDTGMNRLGISKDEFDLEHYNALNIMCIMSHFACADEESHPMNEVQYQNFTAIAAHFPNIPKSLANSSGAFRDPKYHHDIVRSGMALYGLNPTPEQSNPMHPVVKLSPRIIQIRQAKVGDIVGYGATHCFDKDTKLATVSFGYADGISRALSSKGALYWKNYKLPITGRVSMDSISVDLSAIPENEMPTASDYLECLGENQRADDLATAAGTIGYEILTSLGNRYQRIY